MNEHIPVLPNLGEHGNAMNKFRDNQGKIDTDAKAVVSEINIPKMKHIPTQEEQILYKNTSYLGNVSIVIIILAFVIILLILAIVWLVLKYNIIKQESEDKERKARKELTDKDTRYWKLIEELRFHDSQNKDVKKQTPDPPTQQIDQKTEEINPTKQELEDTLNKIN